MVQISVMSVYGLGFTLCVSIRSIYIGLSVKLRKSIICHVK
jgi:hypothetical protein